MAIDTAIERPGLPQFFEQLLRANPHSQRLLLLPGAAGKRAGGADIARAEDHHHGSGSPPLTGVIQ